MWGHVNRGPTRRCVVRLGFPVREGRLGCTQGGNGGRAGWGPRPTHRSVLRGRRDAWNSSFPTAAAVHAGAGVEDDRWGHEGGNGCVGGGPVAPLLRVAFVSLRPPAPFPAFALKSVHGRRERKERTNCEPHPQASHVNPVYGPLEGHGRTTIVVAGPYLTIDTALAPKSS